MVMAEPERAEPISPHDATVDVASLLREEARFHKKQSTWHRKQAQRRLELLRLMKPRLDALGIKLFIDGIDEGGQSQDDDHTEAAG